MKTNLSESTISQAQPAFICSNSASSNYSRIKCEICLKSTTEVPDIVLVSLLLNLSIFDAFF